MKLTTGVKRLDQILDGGLAEQGRVLLSGPSFLGKEVLARQIVVDNMAQSVPAIMVLTNNGAGETKGELAAMHDAFKDQDEAGLLQFVDVYSRAIGADDGIDHVRYVDSPVDLNGISEAINACQKDLIRDHPQHLIVLDSVSTLPLYHDPQAVFRFLQVLVGKARQAGATVVLLLDPEMHAPAEVEMFRHLVDGSIELRPGTDKCQLQVQGFGVAGTPGWLEYTHRRDRFDVVGALAAGRIR